MGSGDRHNDGNARREWQFDTRQTRGDLSGAVSALRDTRKAGTDDQNGSDLTEHLRWHRYFILLSDSPRMKHERKYGTRAISHLRNDSMNFREIARNPRAVVGGFDQLLIVLLAMTRLAGDFAMEVSYHEEDRTISAFRSS